MAEDHTRARMRLQRLLLVIELISPLKGGAVLEDIRSDIEEVTGQKWNRNTINRDINLLVDLKLVKRTKRLDSRGKRIGDMWLWIGSGRRSRSLIDAASTASECL